MNYSISQKKGLQRLALWTGLWVMSLALVVFGAEFLWDYQVTFSVLAILLNVIIGIMMILTNISYIKSLDDLQKLISLQAMSIALGVAVVGGLAYSALDTTNVIPFDAEISHLVMLIGISYLVSILISNYRYK